MLTSRGGVAFVVPHGAAAITGEHVVPVSIDFDGANDWLIGTEDRPGLLRTYVELLNESRRRRPGDTRPGVPSIPAEDAGGLPEMWPALMQPIVERLEWLELSPRAPVLIIPHGALALAAAARGLFGTTPVCCTTVRRAIQSEPCGQGADARSRQFVAPSAKAVWRSPTPEATSRSPTSSAWSWPDCLAPPTRSS